MSFLTYILLTSTHPPFCEVGYEVEQQPAEPAATLGRVFYLCSSKYCMRASRTSV